MNEKEFKTLKDIEWNLGLIPKDNLTLIDEKVKPLFEYKQAIKAEAVKLYKELRDTDEDILMEKYKIFFDNFEPSCEINVIMKFLKWACNLTEGDLGKENE